VTLSAQDEFERLQERSTAEFTARVLGLIAAHARSVPDLAEVQGARTLLGELIAGTSLVSNMLGRRRVRLEVGKIKSGAASYDAMQYAASDQNLLPNVTPERAVEDMVRREPKLAEGYRKVQELYSRERAFALAKSSDVAVTNKVQSVIASALRRGDLLPTVDKIIAELGGWARAYGETVFRTNLSTAYANGRFMEAMDPDFDGFIVGLERMEILDARTRDNHRAAHGLTAAQRDPIWLRLGLPGGYQCRGTYRLVDVYEARRGSLMDGSVMRRAQWPTGAYNDEGFDNRVSFSLMGAF